jgi:hypothetical protein
MRKPATGGLSLPDHINLNCALPLRSRWRGGRHLDPVSALDRLAFGHREGVAHFDEYLF